MSHPVAPTPKVSWWKRQVAKLKTKKKQKMNVHSSSNRNADINEFLNPPTQTTTSAPASDGNTIPRKPVGRGVEGLSSIKEADKAGENRDEKKDIEASAIEGANEGVDIQGAKPPENKGLREVQDGKISTLDPTDEVTSPKTISISAPEAKTKDPNLQSQTQSSVDPPRNLFFTPPLCPKTMGTSNAASVPRASQLHISTTANKVDYGWTRSYGYGDLASSYAIYGGSSHSSGGHGYGYGGDSGGGGGGGGGGDGGGCG
ncbi:hypothetical protein DL98DRAFT_574760 [Cadophora sp. DSE1049]|nr:hypothetical protein DL98DRAFT_574760 [Cadophora sp. DSE1049]